jgi:hypothetical protein
VKVALVNVNKGGSNGVTELLAVDASDVPIAFVAVTVNVYAVPLLNPVTVNGLDEPVAVAPPGLAVAVNDVIAEPPLNEGALNETTTWAFPEEPLTPVGASGLVAPAPPIIMFRIDILS